MLHQSPTLHGLNRSRWRLADLPATLPSLRTYSLTGLSQLLRRLGVRRKRGRLSLHSPDPDYQRKLDWIAYARALARARPDEIVLCYGDEFTLYRQPTLAPVYAPSTATPKAPLSHRSNRTHRYSGALNLLTGQLTWSDAPKMDVTAVRAFLRQLRQTYPDQQVLLVWDNWPVHLHAQVLAEAAEQAIGLLWLPTYAPWTNPIEKLWLWLKQTVLHHHHLADQWPQLHAAVAAFFHQFIAGSTALLRYVGRLPD